jgi:poly-gamma-glutamate synthase PgsB/CapB
MPNAIISALHSFASHWLILVITLLILIYLAVEAISHRYYLSKIPIRIHVNGTRGKSSLTRLIAGGLRKGGIVTCAKTTGTLPRFIDPTGTELAIYRSSRPNILEQIKIIKTAARHQANAIVIECMAVQPLLQSLCELKLIRSTHGVISNVRADHLDVMGPDEADVALALAGTTPLKGHLYTTEKRYLNILKTAASDRNTNLVAISESDVDHIDDATMSKFCYTEHKENVALALRVCADLGVPRDVALRGMWEAQPDPGALISYEIQNKDHVLRFVNAFAANDPISTGKLWHELLLKYPECKRRIALINCRDDRRQRSQQLAEACATWELADQYIVIGTGTSAFIQIAKARGINKLLLIDASDCEPEDILAHIVREDQSGPSLVVGIGNIAGMGWKMVEYFKNPPTSQKRSVPPFFKGGKT